MLEVDVMGVTGLRVDRVVSDGFDCTTEEDRIDTGKFIHMLKVDLTGLGVDLDEFCSIPKVDRIDIGKFIWVFEVDITGPGVDGRDTDGFC